MRIATINRFKSSDEGTFGKFLLDDGFSCFSGELPWRNNEKGMSCIPPGAYYAHWFNSPAHGWCYLLSNVPGRGDVEIHSANFCGDIAKGYGCELKGCIALGMGLGELKNQFGHNQEAILSSKVAIAEFHKRMNGAPLQLVINDPQ